MAYGGTPSYSQWMQQNHDLVQGVQQRYQQPAPVAQSPVQPQQVQPVQPVAQATDTERAPIAGGAPVASVPMQAPPAQANQVGSGAQGGQATEPLQKGTEGAQNLAKTIASFWTGGAASGITGAMGGGGDNRMDATMEPGARQQGNQGGMNLQSILGLVGGIKGMGGGGGGK